MEASEKIGRSCNMRRLKGISPRISQTDRGEANCPESLDKSRCAEEETINTDFHE